MNLALIYNAPKVFKFDISNSFSRVKFTQVSLASIIVPLLECDGVIVITPYSSRSVNIGTIVATLIAILAYFNPRCGPQILVPIFYINGPISTVTLGGNFLPMKDIFFQL